MNREKRKKKILYILCASVIFMAAYMIIYTREEVPLRALNALSYTGLINVLAALFCHVRNSGQFQLLGYSGYSKYKKGLKKEIDEGRIDSSAEIPDFSEYNSSKYEKKWDSVPFFICGLPLLVLAFIFIFFWP